MSHLTSPRREGSRVMAIGAVLLVASVLLFVRAAVPWPGDAIVWPAAVAALGALLIWRAPSVAPRRRRAWAAHSQYEPPSPPRKPSARVRAFGRPEVSRSGLGIALVLAAGLAFLWANGAMRPAGEA